MNTENNEVLTAMQNMFDSLNTKIDSLNTRMDSLNTRMDSLNTRMDSFQDDINNRIDILSKRLDKNTDKVDILSKQLDENTRKLDTVAEDVSKIKITVENEIKPRIGLIAEGHQPIVEKVTSLTEDMEIVKFDVDIVKKVVTTHSKELNKLGKVR